ncbi:hypothetical protein D1Y84_10565 [Acidipila sp. EB88]|nr:hypothetical protein D1Y84_10565 [Acidipila sp. EB88]
MYSSVHWSFFKAGIAKSTALLDRLRGATILEVGGEGGTISLLGNRDKAGGWWLFWLSIDETALLEDLPEKVTTRFSKAAATPSLAHLDKRDLTEGMTRSISEAMLLLDRYPWTRLTPLQVRSEFHAFLLDEVWQRGGPAEADRWTQYLQDRTPQVLRPML